jgi:hypothetical protein
MTIRVSALASGSLHSALHGQTFGRRAAHAASPPSSFTPLSRNGSVASIAASVEGPPVPKVSASTVAASTDASAFAVAASDPMFSADETAPPHAAPARLSATAATNLIRTV